MERYFAYGSNLERHRMSARCPSARAIGNALLAGYRLAFPLTDKNWLGGVAGVLPDEKAQVEGVVYELTLEDLRTLDHFEDVALGDYFREQRELTVADGRRLKAWVYFPGDDGERSFRPSAAYKAALVSGAIENGLSKEYVSLLRSIPTTTDPEAS